MNKDHYDMVVIGAGIHGAGVAQAAAAAGYSVLVLEQSGVASGTSSRSSKLIHGGLRYLESAQFSLVHESLKERSILLKIAPDLVRLVSFHIPVYDTTSRSRWKIRAGLSLYALLGGLGRDNRFRSIPSSSWGRLDDLQTKGLKAVFRYFDGQTDDAALTRAVLHSAQKLGAEFLCPARFIAATRVPGGYELQVDQGESSSSCFASTLVNAAGPWINQVAAKITPIPRLQEVELAQGAHIVVSGTLTAGIYYLEAPQDGRAVFAMPWKGNTLIGTTETRYTGDPEAVEVLTKEVAYLQTVYQTYFPSHQLNVLDRFAGLRVLPAGPGSLFARPRETVFVTDQASPVRLISLYGGKLTGYRATAEKSVAQLRPALPNRRRLADTATLLLDDQGNKLL
ncbi:MAG TPA: FAD-dependent oxidoreductase [Xanthomonadales bacterium]|nr:FAD-dependent oxidoreductase [Xanthomonadales bacterium]